nr:RNA exonuclease 1 homolog [Leptinotarsa decemlineata]
MLPTKGYFQDIECPYFNSSCGRPYCHFRHRKKQSEYVEDLVKESEKESQTVPTYKPTPKSELANIHNNKSHIPISYVPDLTFRPERKSRPIPKFEKPTYKPTPLSILSSANKRGRTISEDNSENIEAIKEIKQNIANVEYDPTISLQTTTDIDFEDLSTEFELIDEIINSSDKVSKKADDSELYDPCKISLEGNSEKLTETKAKCLNDEKTVKNRLKKGDQANSKDKSVSVPVKSTDCNLKFDETNPIDERSKAHNKFEKCETPSNSDSKHEYLQLADNERKSKKGEKPEKKEEKREKKKEKREKKEEKCESKGEKHEKRDNSKNLSSGKSSKEKQDKGNIKKNTSHHTSEKSKEREKEDRHKKTKRGHEENSKESNTSDKSNEREDKTDKKKCPSSSREKQKTSEVDKVKSERSEATRKNRDSRIENSSKSKEKHKTDIKSSDRSVERPKNEHKKTHSHSTSKEQIRKEKEYKSKHHSSKKQKESESKNKQSHDKSPSNYQSHKYQEVTIRDVESNKLEDNSEFVSLDHSGSVSPDSEVDDDETMLECYKIFNEYTPPKNDKPEKPDEYIPMPLIDCNIDNIGKKRVAHGNTEQTQNFQKIFPPTKPKAIITPGQTLANRYKIAHAAQARKEQELVMNEMQFSRPLKRPAPSLLEAARERKIRRESLQQSQPKSTCLVDEILKGTSKTCSQVKIVTRIAPAQNVSLMAKAKERISKIKQTVTVKTVAQTQKGNRTAHIPDVSLSDIPDVLQSDKSKLPVNVRTRFLTMLADECVKLYISKEEAYTRALNEEYSCYEKCKVLTTYRNSAMLAVNRLRKEIQERNKNGLGLIGLDDNSDKDPSSSSRSRTFYNNVKKWLLTEEELDLHGYPRLSEEHHGRAVIKNVRNPIPQNLDENQRICARCHKLYHVDDDGWPLFEEECSYHPLKKRTIRGEQTYLCCRSNESSGCATSDTHVSESACSAELEGYQTTLDPEYADDSRSYAVYALDCEMCYTTKGLELTRVTVVDIDCKTVYESLVKPLNPIIDYNTRFSGITKEQMDKTSTSILQIQANILHLCNSKTILVGHSLESDMKALKIVHNSVIDTSVLFPHKMGLPHKRGLKVLASEYLRKIIQNDVSGHDSAEDAITCMELLKWKLKDDYKGRS